MPPIAKSPETVIAIAELESVEALWFVNSVREALRVVEVRGGCPSMRGQSYTARLAEGTQ
jgi:hypothetical protein